MKIKGCIYWSFFTITLIVSIFSIARMISDFCFEESIDGLKEREIVAVWGKPDVEEEYVGMGVIVEISKKKFLYTDSLATCVAVFVEKEHKQIGYHVISTHSSESVETILDGATKVYVIAGFQPKSLAMRSVLLALKKKKIIDKVEYAEVECDQMVGIYDGRLYVDNWRKR